MSAADTNHIREQVSNAYSALARITLHVDCSDERYISAVMTTLECLASIEVEVDAAEVAAHNRKMEG